jgi:hypothetical protein
MLSAGSMEGVASTNIQADSPLAFENLSVHPDFFQQQINILALCSASPPESTAYSQ